MKTNIIKMTPEQIKEARELLNMIEEEEHLYRSKRFLPGWWIVPGVVVGILLWVLIARLVIQLFVMDTYEGPAYAAPSFALPPMAAPWSWGVTK